MTYRNSKDQSARTTSKHGRCGAMTALAAVAAMLVGCNESSTNTFRTTAADYLETGLNAIADGLIAGLFAVADQSSDTTTQDSTSSGGTGG